MVEHYRTTFTTGIETGAELKANRLAKGLSRRALGKLCGIHPNTVQYWEGKAWLDWTGYSLTRMAEVLSLTIFRSHTRARVHGVSPLSYQKLPNNFKQPKVKYQQCGAKTRQGTPCRKISEPWRRRCRLHGGLSTGPKGLARAMKSDRK